MLCHPVQDFPLPGEEYFLFSLRYATSSLKGCSNNTCNTAGFQFEEYCCSRPIRDISIDFNVM